MIDRLSQAIAARGRWALILGLALGLGWPSLGDALRPAIWPLIMTLLFLAVLRTGPQALRVARADVPRVLRLTVTLQIVAPLTALMLFQLGGVAGEGWALAVVLILSAAPITGAAPITLLAGGTPDLALRQTILGTALLPVTALPTLALVPAFGDAGAVATASLTLLAAIAVATGAAVILHGFGVGTRVEHRPRIDALTAICLALVVVGLMEAAAEAIRLQPGVTMGVLLALIAGTIAAKAVTLRIWPKSSDSAAAAVVAANRNAALFIGVLPAAVVDEMLLVIGLYQIPMYLTPWTLPWLLASRRTD